MFTTTLATPDGTIHAVTVPQVHPRLGDKHGVPVTSDSQCTIGVGGLITAEYARLLTHPAYRGRGVTCPRCGG